MTDILEQARQMLRASPRLAELTVREEDDEFHLWRGDARFARLIPTEKAGVWRMEYFQNRERWEVIDFKGTFKECLAFLSENTHYHFWEG